MLWVKPLALPKNIQDLHLNPDLPICFVLKQKSLIDILVSEYFILSHSLAKPQKRIGAFNKHHTYWAFLNHTGFFKKVRKKAPPSNIVTLLKKVNQNELTDVQIVPITVIWGRGPDTKSKSVSQLLFSDDENAGFFQKILITIFQGKNSYFELSKPFSLKELIDPKTPLSEVAKKIRRILRVHLRKQRTAVLGPVTESAESIYRKILFSKKVQGIITESKNPEKNTKEAMGYLKEIVSKQNSSTIRAFNIVLSRVWSRIFNGFHLEGDHKLTALTKTHTIVYLPCHKSHSDYLLNGYLAHKSGLPVPYFAAGKNLDFFPIGPLLRRGGAFFLRRSFGGKKLYTAVFREYLSYLISSGFHMTAFIEGGRSRTGRLLKPKTGLLSMIIQGYCQHPVRPVAFVPTYIGYDRIIEFKSYTRELQGQKKKKESFLGFLKIWKVFASNYGKIYVNYADPIFLEDVLDKEVSGWRESAQNDKPIWLSKTSMTVALQAMEKIASSNVVSPIDISSLLFLNRDSQTIEEKDYLYFVKNSTQLISSIWSDSDVKVSYSNENNALEYVKKTRVFGKAASQTLTVDDKNLIYFNYYRNETLHLLIMPSLLCQLLHVQKTISKTKLTNNLNALYSILKSEFFLPWKKIDIEFVESILNVLLQEKIISIDNDTVKLSNNPTQIHFVKNMKSIFERSATLASMMIYLIEKNDAIDIDELENSLQDIFKKDLDFIEHKMSFDRKIFNFTLNRMTAAGYITMTVEKEIQTTSNFQSLASASSLLFTPKLAEFLEKNT